MSESYQSTYVYEPPKTPPPMTTYDPLASSSPSLPLFPPQPTPVQAGTTGQHNLYAPVGSPDWTAAAGGGSPRS